MLIKVEIQYSSVLQESIKGSGTMVLQHSARDLVPPRGAPFSSRWLAQLTEWCTIHEFVEFSFFIGVWLLRTSYSASI